MRKLCCLVILVVLAHAAASHGAATEEALDGEQMLAELQQKMGEESAKPEELRPQLEAFSESMKKDIAASIDKGFVELEELAAKLDETSRATEAKVKELLSSEEYTKFKEFVAGIDREAMEAARQKLADELSEVLELTEEQAAKLEPMLKENVNELSEIVAELKETGNDALQEFSNKYEELSKSLRDQLEKSLEKEQLEKFDEYQRQKRDKIAQEVFEV